MATTNTGILQFTTILNSFQLAGCNLQAPEGARILNNPGRLFIPFISSLLWLTSMGSYNIKHYRDIKETSAALLIIVQSCLSFAKIFLFLAKASKFTKLIKELEQFVMKANEKELEVWHKQSKQALLICRSYYIACWLTVSLFVLTPFILMFGQLALNGHTTLLLPFQGLFPYDYKYIFNYILTYIVIAVGAQFVGSPTIAVDSLFIWYVYQISAHFRILRIKFENVAQQLDERNYMEFQHDISIAIRYHSHTVALSKEFSTVFSQIIFTDITFSCFLICFLTYVLGSRPDTSYVPFTLMALVVIVSQVMIYCFGGAKIQNECELFSEALYLIFPWYRMSPKMKRLILLPLMRAQRSSTLSGYFFIVDRALLLWIFRTAFSFTALLFAVSEDKPLE